MIFKELKEKIILEENEIVINKKINIEGKEVLLLSFIKDSDSNKLWTMHISNGKEEDEQRTFNTNRDELINNIKRRVESELIEISEMIIQGQVVIFQSSYSSSIKHLTGMQMIMIQHFIKTGMITDEWDNINVNDIIITIYEQLKEESFPEIQKNEKIEITLKIDEKIKEVLVQYPFIIKLGKLNKNTKINYLEEEFKKEGFFYLNEIEKYDIWKDTLEKIENNINCIEESERDNFKNNTIESLEKNCPKNMDLLTISYETEDDSQLNFFTKEYLEKEPIYNEEMSMLFLSCGNETGINGYSKRMECLKTIEKDFLGELELEIELFSKYVKIPEKIVRLD